MKRKLINILALVSLLCTTACGNAGQAPQPEQTQTEQTAESETTDKTIPADDVKNEPSTPAEKLAAGTSGKVNLSVWVPEKEAEVTASLIDGFKAEYSDVDLEINLTSLSSDSIYEDVMAGKAEAADVFEFTDDMFQGFYEAGVLSKADGKFLYDVVEADTAGAVKAVSSTGEVYGYPLSIYNGCFMYYDEALFAEADLTSLDKMGEKAKAAGKKIAFETDNAWYLYSFFGAEGTGLSVSISSDGISNECNWNDPAGEDVANAIIDYVKGGILESVASNDEALQGFEKGKYAAMVSGPWSAEDLKESASGNIAACVLPTFKAGGKECRMVSFAGYRLLGVSSASHSSEWAKLLAEYLSAKDAQLKRYGTNGECPAMALTGDETEIADDMVTKALNAQSEHAVPLRVGTNYYAPAAMLGEALSDGNAAGRSVKQLLKEVAEGISSEVME